MKNSGDFRKLTKSMISHRLCESAWHANESPTRGGDPPTPLPGVGSAGAVLGPETTPNLISGRDPSLLTKVRAGQALYFLQASRAM